MEKEGWPLLQEEVVNVLAELGAGSTPADQRRNWEEGRADYQGADSWDNIQRQLDQNLPK